MELGDIKALVVDDSGFIRKKMVSALTKMGLQGIQEAENGLIGLEKIYGGNFHVALLDINMPEMTGVEVVSALKAKGHPIYLIMCSSLDTEENIGDIKNFGVRDFIYKPFTPEKIQEALVNFLKTQK